jgi:hypothetical protein
MVQENNHLDPPDEQIGFSDGIADFFKFILCTYCAISSFLAHPRPHCRRPRVDAS